VNSLGMTLIIEGVETTDQLEYLKQRQCSYIQGFLFSKPLPFSELIHYLRQVALVTV